MPRARKRHGRRSPRGPVPAQGSAEVRGSEAKGLQSVGHSGGPWKSTSFSRVPNKSRISALKITAGFRAPGRGVGVTKRGQKVSGTGYFGVWMIRGEAGASGATRRPTPGAPQILRAKRPPMSRWDGFAEMGAQEGGPCVEVSSVGTLHLSRAALSVLRSAGSRALRETAERSAGEMLGWDASPEPSGPVGISLCGLEGTPRDRRAQRRRNARLGRRASASLGGLPHTSIRPTGPHSQGLVPDLPEALLRCQPNLSKPGKVLSRSWGRRGGSGTGPEPEHAGQKNRARRLRDRANPSSSAHPKSPPQLSGISLIYRSRCGKGMLIPASANFR